MKTIAIIEDDQAIGDLLEEVLQKEGYAVRRAYSRDRGGTCSLSSGPDLALLDLMLPGLSGEEVLPPPPGRNPGDCGQRQGGRGRQGEASCWAGGGLP